MTPLGAVHALAALAQPTRLEAFRRLVQRGPQGLAAGELALRLEVPPPTLSFHLGQLSQAGLVRARRDGRSIVYAADYDGMAALMGFLTQNCCAGADGCAPPRPAGRARSGSGKARGRTRRQTR